MSAKAALPDSHPLPAKPPGGIVCRAASLPEASMNNRFPRIVLRTWGGLGFSVPVPWVHPGAPAGLCASPYSHIHWLLPRCCSQPEGAVSASPSWPLEQAPSYPHQTQQTCALITIDSRLSAALTLGNCANSVFFFF